jgi:hypothetical protein
LNKNVFALCGLIFLAEIVTWSYLDVRSTYWFVAMLIEYVALGAQLSTVLRDIRRRASRPTVTAHARANTAYPAPGCGPPPQQPRP